MTFQTKLLLGIALLVGPLALGPAPAMAGSQAVNSKSACTKAGGTAIDNPYKVKGERNYPYLCTYPAKLDKACVRKHGEGWYYDVEKRECEPEDDCLIYGDC